MRKDDTAIYLDYAAATPLDDRAFNAMRPFLAEQFYNPSSPYAAGRAVRAALNRARASIAAIIGAKPVELLFTAGATESVNMALYGVAAGFETAHIVTTAVEHTAVLAAARQYDTTVIGVQPRTGEVSVDSVTKAVHDKTVMVSIGYANGELGTIQPLRAIAAALQAVRIDRQRRRVLRPLYLHTDASQAAGLLDIHADRLGVDLMSLNAGKCYGPKQMGLLYVKSPIRLKPLIAGGGQESGLRSGTENVAGIIGFATALERADSQRKTENHRLAKLRDGLQADITRRLPETVVCGSPKRRLPHILHAAWPGVDGERLLLALDERGIMVATGSACAANKGIRSHVLQAIGLPDTVADGSIRFSLGRTTTAEQMKITAAVLQEALMKERAGR